MKHTTDNSMQYYVYYLYFDESQRGYVGLTSQPKKRFSDHKTTITTNKLKNNWISKYTSLGCELKIEILHGPVSLQEACDLEKMEISSRDNLTNYAEGGYSNRVVNTERRRELCLKNSAPRVVVDVVEKKIHYVDSVKIFAEDNGLGERAYLGLLDSQNKGKRNPSIYNYLYQKRYKVFNIDEWEKVSPEDKEIMLSEDYQKLRMAFKRGISSSGGKNTASKKRENRYEFFKDGISLGFYPTVKEFAKEHGIHRGRLMSANAKGNPYKGYTRKSIAPLSREG